MPWVIWTSVFLSVSVIFCVIAAESDNDSVVLLEGHFNTES